MVSTIIRSVLRNERFNALDLVIGWQHSHENRDLRCIAMITKLQIKYAPLTFQLYTSKVPKIKSLNFTLIPAHFKFTFVQLYAFSFHVISSSTFSLVGPFIHLI